MPPLILLIDDDQDWRSLLAEQLRERNYDLLEAATGAEGIRLAGEALPAVVLLDLRLPDLDGIEVLRQIKRLGTETEVVMLTAYSSPKLTIQSVKEGAFDFVQKSAQFDEICVAIQCAAEAGTQRKAAAWLSSEQFRGLILGNSSQIRTVHDQIHHAAQADAAVLITGESGTGKELVARAIVSGSQRRDRTFVTVDCATLSRELIESELFGHERGAFTGAYQRKLGRMELADKGTIFLDEIGELELSLQAKLLRMVERKEFFRVGGGGPVRVDVRVVAATNRNLQHEIAAGRFRSDLYYRLNVVHIHLPPLRDRRDDIPLLAEHFLHRFAREIRKPITGFGEEVLEGFMEYQWPGNVRELENTVQRMVIFEKGSLITPDVLPQEIKGHLLPAPGRSDGHDALSRLVSGSACIPLEDATQLFRSRYIARVLQEHGGKVEAAAQALKINRTHLYKILKLYGLPGKNE